MARYKVPNLNSESRLRKWGPGRVAQLKLFLGHLVQAVGVSLAAQVEQSPKRRFSEFVPKIVTQDITLDVEYKELRFSFEAPRGLRNLLFYEFQIGLTLNFFQFDQFSSPNPNFYFPNLLDDTTYFIRARVVTKTGLVGPWSDPQSATTPFSQAFGLYDGTEFSRIIASTNFSRIFDRGYTAIGGKAYYSIDYELSAQLSYDPDNNIEHTDVEFQWLIDVGNTGTYNQVGQNFLISAYASHEFSSVSGSDMTVTTDSFGVALFLPGTFEVTRRGTLVQKFSTLTSGDNTIRLQARLLNQHPTDNEFSPGANTAFAYGANAFIKLKNFNIFEALVS